MNREENWLLSLRERSATRHPAIYGDQTTSRDRGALTHIHGGRNRYVISDNTDSFYAATTHELDSHPLLR